VLASRLLYGSRPHVPDFVAKDNAKYHLVTDARGSVRLAIDVATGQVVQRIDYDAWGNILRNTNPSLHPFAYAGGLYDADTRLTRFGARDYDAETGRWTAKDPIGFHGGVTNLCAYVGNDPVNMIDPEGTDAWSAAGSFVEGVAWSVAGGIVVSAGLASGTLAGGLIKRRQLQRPEHDGEALMGIARAHETPPAWSSTSYELAGWGDVIVVSGEVLSSLGSAVCARSRRSDYGTLQPPRGDGDFSHTSSSVGRTQPIPIGRPRCRVRCLTGDVMHDMCALV
jgi:RHS repeat-associated protein